MPLRCLDGGLDVHAFGCSEADWERLRAANAEWHHLRMPCCNAGVVLKTSKLGTRFFAHARSGVCATAPETEQHLLAKAQVAERARQSGWQATTEARGEGWAADVLAERDGARYAFEVQWSRQSAAETAARQARYRAAQVQGIWLLRHPGDVCVERDTPTFRLRFDAVARRFDVQLPSPRFDPFYSGRLELTAPSAWQQTVALPDFVVGALNGALRWAPALGARVPLEVRGAAQTCWRCRRPTTLVLALRVRLSALFPGFADEDVTLRELDELLDADAVSRALPAEALRAHGAGVVKPRFSRTTGTRYLSNGCVHCDALQGRFFEHEHVNASAPLFATEILLPAVMPDESVLGATCARWWFDASKVPG